MGARLLPFEGHVVAAGGAPAVVAPPYDLLTPVQRRAMAAADPRSFLNVLPPGPIADVDLEHTLQACRRSLDRLLADGSFRALEGPALAVVTLQRGDTRTAAIVGDLDVAAFEDGTVLPHERVRPDRVEQLVRYLEVVGVASTPVALTHRRHPPVEEVTAAVVERPPRLAFRGEDGTDVALWLVDDTEEQAALADAVAAAGHLYVADGHHRAAAIAAYAARSPSTPAGRRVLTAVVPCDHLDVQPFHRLLAPVPDLRGEEVLRRLEAVGIAPAERDRPYVPAGTGRCGLTVDGRWWALDLRERRVDGAVEGLDVRLVEREVIGPLLETDQPADDPRVHAVAAPAGPEALVREDAVGLTLPAPGIEAVLRVADAGAVMPAKTTYVEPKLRSGLVLSPR